MTYRIHRLCMLCLGEGNPFSQQNNHVSHVTHFPPLRRLTMCCRRRTEVSLTRVNIGINNAFWRFFQWASRMPPPYSTLFEKQLSKRKTKRKENTIEDSGHDVLGHGSFSVLPSRYLPRRSVLPDLHAPCGDICYTWAAAAAAKMPDLSFHLFASLS